MDYGGSIDEGTWRSGVRKNCYRCAEFPKCARAGQVIDITTYKDAEPVYLPSANADVVCPEWRERSETVYRRTDQR